LEESFALWITIENERNLDIFFFIQYIKLFSLSLEQSGTRKKGRGYKQYPSPRVQIGLKEVPGTDWWNGTRNREKILFFKKKI